MLFQRDLITESLVPCCRGIHYWVICDDGIQEPRWKASGDKYEHMLLVIKDWKVDMLMIHGVNKLLTNS